MYKERNKTRGMGRGGIFRSISFVMLFLMLAGSLAGIGSLLFKNTSILDEAGTGGNVVTAGITGSGNSADDPYVITTKQDLIDFANPSNAATYWRANSFAKLAADIDWGGQDGGSFSMIGNSSTPYQGNFDGNKHAIKAFYVYNISASSGAGFFAYTSNATIKNFGVIGTMHATNNANNNVGIGGIVGTAIGSLTVQDSFNGININTLTSTSVANNFGGIVGLHNSNSVLLIERCFNAGSIYGQEVGGIFGEENAGSANVTIKECFNVGDLKSLTTAEVGGIIGETRKATDKLYDCYNVGNISPSVASGAGGISGFALNAWRCYNVGVASNGGGYGVVSGTYLGTVSVIFNNIDKSSAGGATNRTTVQMTDDNVLTKTTANGGMLELTSGDGTGKWIKRPNDTTSETDLSKRYYPELASMANHEWKVFRDYSKASVVASGFVDPGYKPNEKPVCNSNTTVEVPSIGNGT